MSDEDIEWNKVDVKLNKKAAKQMSAKSGASTSSSGDSVPNTGASASTSQSSNIQQTPAVTQQNVNPANPSGNQQKNQRLVTGHTSSADKPSGTAADLADLVRSMTDDDIRQILPVGLQTPASVLCRYRAYIGGGNDMNSMLVNIKHCRDDPEFARGSGHKRAAMMAAIAIVVHVACKKNARPVSANMQAMVSSHFPIGFVGEFWRLYKLKSDTNIPWLKDGNMDTIDVPASFGSDRELMTWCSAKWPSNSD